MLCAQGYIYIEAAKEAHVREAVSGIRNVFMSKGFFLVPLAERVDALAVNKKAKALLGALKGQWHQCRNSL